MSRAGSVPVIVPAVHDTGSAVAGVPASGRNWAFISSGTWSLVGIEVDRARHHRGEPRLQPDQRRRGRGGRSAC